jgi:hypothetical protein
MTIDTMDALVSAMGNNSSRIIIDKASIASQTGGSLRLPVARNGAAGTGRRPYLCRRLRQ